LATLASATSAPKVFNADQAADHAADVMKVNIGVELGRKAMVKRAQKLDPTPGPRSTDTAPFVMNKDDMGNLRTLFHRLFTRYDSLLAA
jgi:hypothetical protein